MDRVEALQEAFSEFHKRNRTEIHYKGIKRNTHTQYTEMRNASKHAIKQIHTINCVYINTKKLLNPCLAFVRCYWVVVVFFLLFFLGGGGSFLLFCFLLCWFLSCLLFLWVFYCSLICCFLCVFAIFCRDWGFYGFGFFGFYFFYFLGGGGSLLLVVLSGGWGK